MAPTHVAIPEGPMPLLSLILVAAFPAVVIIAALRDATTMTIPNWLCLTGAALFLPAALVAHLSLPGAGLSLACGVGFLIVGMVMFALRWIGGGDAKLLAVCALWMGWPQVMTFLFWTAISGGGLAVVLIGSRRIAALGPAFGPRWLNRLLQPDGDIPYGIAIAIGAMIAYPQSPVFQMLHRAGG